MSPTDYLPPWQITGDSGAVPIGPAMTTLRSVIARLALVVRCAGIAYLAVQVAIWHSYYMAGPWRLAGPAAATAWAAVVVAYLRRRWPGPLFSCIDSAVYWAFALGIQWCLPPSIHGDAFNWLLIIMSGQIIVPAWYAPAALRLPLAFASPVAYRIGAALAGNTGGRPTAAAVLLIMIAGVHSYCQRKLYSRAAAADAALDEADRDAGEQYVILSRNLERREHERLLHDTVLNTLTAMARAGGDDTAEVVRRCRQDVALIERALTDPGDQDAAPGGDVAARVRAVAAEMRTRGLTVHVDIAADGAPAIPAPVATAISNAVREALSNVAAHAGTGEAWVDVSLTSPQPQRRLKVTVRDNGAGFDPARVAQARLGLRRSIAERIADCGGQASIWSAPGRGTVVTMSWSGPAEPGRPAEADRVLGQESLRW